MGRGEGKGMWGDFNSKGGGAKGQLWAWSVCQSIWGRTVKVGGKRIKTQGKDGTERRQGSQTTDWDEDEQGPELYWDHGRH